LNKWLKKFLHEKLIKKIKGKKKRPYYIADFENASYKNKKKLYALEQFYKTGFLNHLMEMDAKTVVIFGSFARADWHTNSDIDIFILGDAKEFQQAFYEKKLGRVLQLFIYKNKRSIQKGLLKSISEGYTVKGNLNA